MPAIPKRLVVVGVGLALIVLFFLFQVRWGIS